MSSLPFPCKIPLLPVSVPTSVPIAVPFPIPSPTTQITKGAPLDGREDVSAFRNLGEIYMITDKRNGKRYIGQTKCVHVKNGKEVINHAEDRFKEHLQKAFSTNEETRLSCPRFYEAIREVHREKLREVFEVTMLERCLQWELNVKEKYYIKLWKTRKNGYNITTGGQKARRRRYK